MRAVGARHWMDDVPTVEPLRFRSAPMLAAACCFTVGEIFARHGEGTAFLTAALVLSLVLIALSAVFAKRLLRPAAMTLWVVVGCWCALLQPPVARQDALGPYADGLSRMVRGRVEQVRPFAVAVPSEETTPSWQAEPGAWEAERGDATESVDLAIDQIEDVTPDTSTMRAMRGGVRVTVQGEASALRCGDAVEMPLRLRLPDVYRDPGAWSHGDELLREGVGAQASVSAARIVVVRAGGGSWECRLRAAQMWAAGRVQGFVASRENQRSPKVLRLDARDAAILDAMLFGDRSALTRSLRAGFERTGTFHLFVVSGLHVALIATMVFWVMRRLRVPEGAAVALTISIAAGFASLTGFGVPVQRALWMSAAYLIARWLARESGALNALGAAALVVLAIDPRSLFEASFQMTFLVIVAIAGVAAPLAAWMLGGWRETLWELEFVRWDSFVSPRIAQRRVRLRSFAMLLRKSYGQGAAWGLRVLLRGAMFVVEALLFALVTELCMVVPMAVYFHRVTVLALPANLLAIPLIAVLLCAAIVFFVTALVGAWAAVVPGACVALMLHGLSGLIGHLGRSAVADFRVPGPGATVLWMVAGLVVLAVLAVRRKSTVAVGCVVLCAVPLLTLWPQEPLLHRGVVEVTALDVGQGDSLLVVSPDAHTMLVDAGGPVGQALLPDRWDVGEEVVAPYLWSRRISRLDVVVLTHAHSDHMGGMEAVLRDMRPRELWVSVEPKQAEAMRALLREAAELGVVVRWMRAGDAVEWGAMKVDVLSPERGYANDGGAVNDDSLVLRMRYEKASVLLEGDAEAASEAAMVRDEELAPVTLLKVGHHGSITSTGAEFLAKVKPKDAVISVGRRNTFGHPRMEVLQRLQDAGVKVFRTDRMGAETFLLAADGSIVAKSAASN